MVTNLTCFPVWFSRLSSTLLILLSLLRLSTSPLSNTQVRSPADNTGISYTPVANAGNTAIWDAIRAIAIAAAKGWRYFLQLNNCFRSLVMRLTVKLTFFQKYYRNPRKIHFMQGNIYNYLASGTPRPII